MSARRTLVARRATYRAVTLDWRLVDERCDGPLDCGRKVITTIPTQEGPRPCP